MTFPPFEPHPLLRDGHTQTIAGRYLPARLPRLAAIYHEVEVDEGDRLAVLDSTPTAWKPGDPAAILVHGLAGCARAPYVVRVAARLSAAGVRVVRMNLRNAGAGFGAARRFYHAGRTGDLRAVCEWLAARAIGSPIALVGFSLGGNLALKLAAEAPSRPVPGLDCVLAASPPIDLVASSRFLGRGAGRAYDRNFVRILKRDVARLHAAFPELGRVDLSTVGSLYDFDDVYTAPRNGFADAEDYYRRSSSAPLLTQIEIPGLVVHASDDPFIPEGPFLSVRFPEGLALELLSRGGHLGFISRRRAGGDRRWLDARLVSWLTVRWGIARRRGDLAGVLAVRTS